MQPGDEVPDFEATLHDGNTVRLSQLLADGPVVLFFYPKAFTSGCSAEVRHFHELADQFEQAGSRPVGVSRDRVDTQARFCRANELGFPLVSDPRGQIARIFGAKRPGPIPNRRQTFLVDTDRTLLGVVTSETNMQRHADDSLELVRQHTRR